MAVHDEVDECPRFVSFIHLFEMVDSKKAAARPLWRWLAAERLRFSGMSEVRDDGGEKVEYDG